ncbi:MAG: PASTA domain-containing protein [Acidimicrobiales bacterium]
MTVATVDLGVPHLHLQSMLGRGGFSVVYKAFDTKFNRHVAVKVLTAAVDGPARQLFEQECQLHGPVSGHPHIVTIHDAGTTPDGHPYLVMEHVEGGTLADRVAAGPLPWRQAVDLVIPVCEAVDAAHRRGVLHRDIKPANILLGPDGPKLADFGIACVSDATSPQFAVSWHHAPPEAESNRRDVRSDVYSLGSTLFAAIAGHAPFWRPGEDSLGALLMRLVDQPTPHLPAEVAPSWLDDVVQWATAKDPRDRPQRAADLADALRQGRNHGRVGAGPWNGLGVAVGSPTGSGAMAPSAVEARTAVLVPLPAPDGTGTIGASTGRGATSEVVTLGLRQAQSRRRPRRRGRGLAVTAAVLALALVGLAVGPAASLLRTEAPDGRAVGGASSTDDPTTPSSDVPVETVGDSSTTATTEAGPTSTVDGGPATTNETSAPSTSLSTSTSTSAISTSATSKSTTSSTSSSTSVTVPAHLVVPTVAGLSAVAAQDQLDDAGFTDVTTISEANDDVAAGIVVRTTPAAGTSSAPDDPLTVVVSSGPELVTVPNVVGEDRASAEAALAEAGLVPVVQVEVVDDEADHGLVLSQSPNGSGAGVAPGTEVTIVVGRVPSTVPPVGGLTP